MIKLQNVSVSYDARDEKSLDDVTLSINKNDFCIVMGANGCGKSTLLKIISEEIKPSKGGVNIKGDIAKVVQDINLGVVSEMSILENLALSEIRKPGFKPYRQYQKKAKEMLSTLHCHLDIDLNRKVSALSGGQRQMLATLMAMNSQKPILLLDEHTSALDINMQNRLMSYTANEIQKRQLTTVMITHKFDDALAFGNRLIIMSRGKIAVDLNREEKKKIIKQELMDLFYQAEGGVGYGN